MSKLADLQKEIAACRLCGLSQGRTRVVPGEGPEDSRLVFIGEAPGFNEDQQGRPFVGAAGQFLEELLASIHLRRQQVYICNVIKCRPPNNRDPLPGEIEACRPWLEQQLAVLQPRVIVTLGRYSMARYFPGETISRVHGKGRRLGDVLYFPMYHPAAALHQQSLRQVLLADIMKLPALLEAEDEKAQAAAKPQQLGLF